MNCEIKLEFALNQFTFVILLKVRLEEESLKIACIRGMEMSQRWCHLKRIIKSINVV